MIVPEEESSTFSGWQVQERQLPRAHRNFKLGGLELKKSLAVALTAIFASMSFGFRPTYAQANYDQAALKARATVEQLGVGTGAKVEVKLRDTTKLKGYISQIGDDSFTVTDSKGTSDTVKYSEVVQVKKAGGGWGTRNWLIVGGVAAAAVTTWVIVKPALCDGGAQTRGPC